MYYCDTTYSQVNCPMVLFRRRGSFLQNRARRVGRYLKDMVTPEPSGPNHRPGGKVHPRWLGALKTLFWTVNAIVIGIILAAVCS